MSADLLEWLTGCLDHLEAAAVAASRSDSSEWSVALPGTGWAISEVVRDADWPSEEQAELIALNDPRAVLARVEAERAIVGLHAPMPSWSPAPHCEACDRDYYWRKWEPQDRTYPCDSLRLLAWGHRFDFPGYDTEAWAPEGADRGDR